MKGLRAITITVILCILSLGILGSRQCLADNVVRVAILDTGCNITYKEGLSFVDNTVKDFNGHGTLIAKIVKEIYPSADLYIIKVMSKNGFAVSEEAVILGMEWAIAKNVNIINMSLRLKDSQELHRVIRRAYAKGILLVAAAGNRETKRSNASCLLNRNTDEGIAYPARYPEVIAVGALDRNNKIYAASTKGDGIEIYCKGYKGKKAGTSVAAAYATGFTARLLSTKSAFNITTLRNFICQTYKNRVISPP